MPKECDEQADGSPPSWSDPVVLLPLSGRSMPPGP